MRQLIGLIFSIFPFRNPHFKVSGSSTHNKVSTSLYIDYDDDIVSVLFVVTIGVLPLKVRQWIRGVGDENKSDFGDDDI